MLASFCLSYTICLNFINRILLAKAWWEQNVIILYKELVTTRVFLSENLYCPCFLLRDIHALRVVTFHTLEGVIHPPSRASERVSRAGQLCVTGNWLIVVFQRSKLLMHISCPTQLCIWLIYMYHQQQWGRRVENLSIGTFLNIL